jgi:hypothetical protein
VLLVPSVLISFGMPFAFIPSTISATSGVRPQEAGLASAVANTARMIGGALGLAVLATVATNRSAADLRHPTLAIHTANAALLSGFQLAFWIGAAITAAGMIFAAVTMPGLARNEVAQPQGAIAVEM